MSPMRCFLLLALGVISLGGFGAHFIWTASGRRDFEERLEEELLAWSLEE